MRDLRALLIRTNEPCWLPGITAAISALEAVRGGPAAAARAALAEAGSIYRTMTRGAGSFGDFYVAKPDPAEQARENAALSALADRLWSLLGDVR